MEKYNIVKLRSYLVHLVIGAAVLILGGSVLYSILSEMLQVYDPGSKYAYIFGIIACALILLIGLFFIVKAFGFENQVFKHVSFEDRARFFEELGDEQTLFFDRYLFVTRHYLLAYVKSWNPQAKLLKIQDLIGCFGKPYYAGSDELVQYDVIFCDKDFHLYCCAVKGKKAAMMEEAWKAVCSLAPWVFHDDYVDFVAGLTKKSKKRSYIKIVEHRKKLEEVSEDTIQNAVISAADVIKSFNEQSGRREKKPLSMQETQRLERLNPDVEGDDASDMDEMSEDEPKARRGLFGRKSGREKAGRNKADQHDGGRPAKRSRSGPDKADRNKIDQNDGGQPAKRGRSGPDKADRNKIDQHDGGQPAKRSRSSSNNAGRKNGPRDPGNAKELDLEETQKLPKIGNRRKD